MNKRVVLVFWNDGGYYFSSDPSVRFKTEASMLREAYKRGFTHVETRYRYYVCGMGLIDDLASSRCRFIPKRYRVQA